MVTKSTKTKQKTKRPAAPKRPAAVEEKRAVAESEARHHEPPALGADAPVIPAEYLAGRSSTDPGEPRAGLVAAAAVALGARTGNMEQVVGAAALTIKSGASALDGQPPRIAPLLRALTAYARNMESAAREYLTEAAEKCGDPAFAVTARNNVDRATEWFALAAEVNSLATWLVRVQVFDAACARASDAGEEYATAREKGLVAGGFRLPQ